MAVKITAIPWGRSVFGEAVTLRRVESDTLSFEVLDYGATLRCLCVKDTHGAWVDVVLGYDTLAEYKPAQFADQQKLWLFVPAPQDLDDFLIIQRKFVRLRSRI